jgi:hypothetical protein
LAEVEVHGGNHGEEKAEASHADKRLEGFRVVKICTLTASLGHEVSLKARYFNLCVRIDFVDPHAMNDRAIGVEVNKFSRAIAHEGVILMLHGSLPVKGLSAGEGGTGRG